MSKAVSRAWLRFALRTLVVFILILLLAACSRSGGPSREAHPVAVRSAVMERGALPNELEFTGEIIAPERASISASVAGRIERVTVRLGDAVKAGDRLVEIDSDILTAQKREAEAGVLAADAAVSRAQTDAHNVAAELERIEQLAAKKLVTDQDLDNIRAKRQSVDAALVSAKAQYEQALARVATLAAQIAQTRVSAPFDGMVEARFLDPGTVVAPGTPILALTRIHPATLRFSIPERHVAVVSRAFREGTPTVTLRVDGYPNVIFTGQIARTSPVLEAGSRSRLAEVDFPNEDGKLLPGMFGRITLRLGTVENALLLPLVAFLDFAPSAPGAPREEGSGSGRIFVVRDGKALRLTARVGLRVGDVGELLDGPQAQDRVIVEGQHLLKDGSPVLDQADNTSKSPMKKGAMPPAGREG